MTQLLQTGIARVRRTAGGPVIGTGFLISPRHVMTCAHVLNEAFKRAWNHSAAPTEQVWIEFPFAGSGDGLAASVVEWHPPAEAEASDIAVLQLLLDVSFRSRPYRTSNIKPWRGQAFWTKGFPVGQDGGVDADGIIGTEVEFGRLLARGDGLPGFFIEGGFSGAPVLDENTGAVLGMVAAAVRDETKRTAFFIPACDLHLAWPPLAHPYKGLGAFQEVDARFFNGREDYVDELAAKLDRGALVAVVGRSGSGKSSLVRAGLVPRLHQSGDWRVVTFRPAAPALDPFRNLAAALFEATDPPITAPVGLRDVKALEDLAAALRDRPATIVEHLLRMTNQNQPDPPRVLLIADQFEELFTLVVDPAEADPDKSLRGRLVRCLRAVTDTTYTPEPAARCVITIRADYMGQALTVLDMAEALKDADVKLGPMTVAQLRRAIEAPAQALGVTFADGLVDDLLHSVGNSADALPLIEFTLTELWARQQDRILRPMPTDSEDTPGSGHDVLVAPLIRHAEGVFSDLSRRFSEPTFRKVMVSLVWLSDPSRESEDTRRVRRKDEFGAEEWQLIEQLVSQDRQARLVTAGARQVDGQPTAEIVHEVLIRGWPRLRKWLAEDRAFRLWLQKIEAGAADWRRSSDPSDLLYGRRLSEAMRWKDERIAQDLTSVADFLDASQLQDEVARARKEAEHQRALVLEKERQDNRLAEERRRVEAEQATERERLIHEAEVHRLETAAAIERATAADRLTRRTRLAAIGLLVLLLMAIGVSVYAEHERRYAELALGRSLWGKLDFGNTTLGPDEIDVLWQVATASAPVRAGFIAPLTSAGADLGATMRFARMPDAVLRAIGVGNLSAAEVTAILANGLAALGTASDPKQIRDLSSALSVLPIGPTPEQLAQPLAAILRVLADPASFAHLQDIASALRALAGALSPEQAEATQQVVLAALMTTTNPDQLFVLNQALRAVVARLDSEQAGRMLPALLAHLRSTADAHQIGALADVAQALASGLSSKEAAAQVRPFLDSLRGTIDPEASKSFAGAVQTLIDRLGPARALSEFPQALEALTNPIDYGHFQAMGQAVIAIAHILPAAQAPIMLARLLTALSSATDPEEVQVLGHAAQALADRLPAKDSEDARSVLLAKLDASVVPATTRVLATALRALQGGLSVAQRNTAIDHVLNLIAGVADADGLADLAQALQAFPGSLSPAQAYIATATLLRMLRTSTDPNELAALVTAAQSLAEKLPPDVAKSEQEAISGLMPQAADADQLTAIAQTLATVPGRLDPGVTHRSMGILLKALADTTDPDERQALAIGIKALANRLEANEASADLQPILATMAYSDDAASLSALELALAALLARLDAAQLQASLATVLHGFIDANSPAQRQAEADLITAMSGRLSKSQTTELGKLARSRLANAGSQAEAASWANTIAAIARLAPDTERATIIEVLRYPTAAGRPTQIFLTSLNERDPEAVSPQSYGTGSRAALYELLAGGGTAHAPVWPLLPALDYSADELVLSGSTCLSCGKRNLKFVHHDQGTP